MAFAGVTAEGLGWGEIKGLLLRNLRAWLRLPIFDRDGVLTVGYGYPNLCISEGYNAPGSPYWGLKAFFALALPQEHPFWQAEEKPYMPPLRFLDEHVRLLLTRDPENRQVVEKLKTVLQYIREHYQQPVTVGELAELCHFSEYYFMRFFKQYMNTTCIEYMNQYRMEIAAGKLLSGVESVTDIALDTGFHNISYFNRVFKKKFGMTPKEYRKAFRETEK